MKQDKHKAKRSAKYRKQHAANSDSKCKTSKQSKSKGGKSRIDSNETSTSSTSTSYHEEIINKKQDAKLVDDFAKSQSFSKRKIECNWEKYENFPVEEEVEKRTVARGANFQTLISQSDGASAQLRLKGEEWNEESRPDEKESDIGDIFKVDFREVADRLQAVPLYERFGISVNYFEKDVLDRIQADAACHASRVQRLYDEELKSKGVEKDHLAKNRSAARDFHVQGQSVSTTNDCKLIRSKSDNSDSLSTSSETKKVESKSDTSESASTNDENRVESKSSPETSSDVQVGACLRLSNDVQLDEIERDSCNRTERIRSDDEAAGSSPAVQCGTTEELVTDGDRGASGSTTTGTTQHETHATAEAPLPQSQDGEEDLEDWLDDFLGE